MKKFHFTLDTVLSYKQQVLEELQSEHAALIQRVVHQEQLIAELQRRYRETNAAFREAEKKGMTIAEALGFEGGLRALERQMELEKQRLTEFRREAEKKRQQVVGARQETASLEKLREKKLEQYGKAVQKHEEQFIDELVSAGRVSSAGEAG